MANEAKMVRDYVRRQIATLQNDSPQTASKLARLRRGLGKDPAETPDIWEITLKDLPEELEAKGRNNLEPSNAEWAIHVTLTLYALHQQGRDTSAYNPDRPFAVAIRMMVDPEDESGGPIKRRFDSMLGADTVRDLAQHARGIIQLMKSSGKDLSFDYPSFAVDLYFYGFPDGRDSVRLKWGQDFYKPFKNEAKTEEESRWTRGNT